MAATALLQGCKGNTSAAASVDRRAGQPPVVLAQRIPVSGDLADPISSKVWRDAEWWSLVAPANTAHTTAPSRAAVLFDANTLYVAVINDLPKASDTSQDVVSLYVDTSGEGKELLQVTADIEGRTRSTWIRSSVPVGPLEDGSPNIGYPLDIRPDFAVRGLEARVGRGVADGRAVWTVEFALPVTGLPKLMQIAPAPGAPWRFNILRTVTRGNEQYQSNLAPVYVNAQAASAYRMAELDFASW